MTQMLVQAEPSVLLRFAYIRSDGGPGALPSALGFESLTFPAEKAEERRRRRLSSVLVDSKGLEPLTFRTSSGSSTS